MISIQPNRYISVDPQHYFADPDYCDYRELVCYERPACFILHFYFGFTASRLWLMDRFAFDLGHDGFSHRSNSLADFMRETGIVECIRTDLRGCSLDELVRLNLSGRSALVVPVQTQFGESVVVSSILIEGMDGTNLICTSLRGDDFYVAKRIPIDRVRERLYCPEEWLETFTIRVSAELLDLALLPHPEIWRRYSLMERLVGVRNGYYRDSSRGSDRLRDFQQRSLADAPPAERFLPGRPRTLVQGEIHSPHPGHEAFARKVTDGFHNVLLAEIFWPMLFAYSPFVVFLRNALRSELVPDGTLWRNRTFTLDLIAQMGRESQIVTNLGLLYGRQPEDRNFRRFHDALTRICSIYEELETEFIEATNGSR